MKRPRRNHSSTFKAKVALSALKSDRFGAADLHRSTTPPQLLANAAEVFSTPIERRAVEGPSVKDLQAKIGQLAMENDFLASALGRMGEPSAKR